MEDRTSDNTRNQKLVSKEIKIVQSELEIENGNFWGANWYSSDATYLTGGIEYTTEITRVDLVYNDKTCLLDKEEQE